MRPWIIMGSAAVIAFLMAGAITFYSIAAPAPIPIHTTIEEPGGIKLNPAAADSTPWDIRCVSILTAPVSMRVDDISKVGTTLLLAAGPGEIASLLQAVKNTETAIDTASPASPIDPDTGLDKSSTDALRRMVDSNQKRQANIDTLPGPPISITVHLIGPSFKIKPVTSERQGITGKQPSHWQWTIKALDPGPRILTVSYSAEVEIAGQRVPEALHTSSRHVMVNVVPPPTALLKQVADQLSSAKAIVENASWLWTFLSFPALMFLYGVRRWFRERHAHP
jgi:hypothetical protein